MRITIEIDGAETVVKTAQAVATTSADAMPPPEVAAKAAASGAQDAGPSPAISAMASDSPSMLLSAPGSTAPISAANALAAGAAPDMTSQATAVVTSGGAQ